MQINFFPRHLSDEDREDLQRWLDGVPELSLLTAEQEAAATPDQLVEHNLRLACKIAMQFAGRGVPISDLIQEGCIGLMRAARDFDPSRSRFVTYATPAVLTHVQRAVHNCGNTIRVPAHAHQIEALSTRVQVAARAAVHIESLDRCKTSHDGMNIGTSKKASLADSMPSHADTAADALRNIERDEARRIVAEVIRKSGRLLTPGERRVFLLRYVSGLGNAEIAERLGYTVASTRQTLHMATKKLRAAFAGVEAPYES